MKTSIEEYNSLRTEIISRINIMNTQAFSSLTFAIATWIAGFSLLEIQISNIDSLSMNEFLALSLGEIFAFFMTILLMVPVAVKSGENLKQILLISVYLRVFHEYKSEDGKSWEICNTIISKSTSSKGMISSLRFMNSEYFLLSITSVVFMIGAFSSMLFTLYTRFEISVGFLIRLIVVGFVFVFLTIVLVINVNRESAVWKNIMADNKSKINQCIDFAVSSERMTPDEAYKAKKSLDPDHSTETFGL